VEAENAVSQRLSADLQRIFTPGGWCCIVWSGV